jgi:signal transduction histidine kinase
MGGPRTTLVIVAIVGVVSCASALLLPSISPIGYAEGDSLATVTFHSIVGLLWLAAALVTLVRQPANPLWKLILIYVLWNWFFWALQWTPYPMVQGIAFRFAPLAPVVLAHILVAYPSGHLRTRFDRAVVGTVYLVVLGSGVLGALLWQPDPSCSSAFCPQNILLVWPANDLADAIGRALSLAVPLIGAAVVLAVWRHWRAAAPAARRVLLPVVVAVPAYYAVYAVSSVGGALELEPLMAAIHLPSLVANAIVPLGVLLGVLRMRLDRGRVAGLVVELGRGVPVGGLRDVLARALGDPTLQLAFATPGAAGYIDGAGRPVELVADAPGRALARIERNGEPLAVLVHDPAIDEEDPGLVEAVSSAARLAIENERLTAQVRAQLEEVRVSRARIVEATDEGRRRVERDLHDGAQQRLVALAMRLEQARASTEGSARLIDETTAELREAIAEVRGLARGLYPPILTEAGLAAAVESLAERASIPVEVRIPDTRFPPAVEVTAYFVVAEALTNTSRHAGATTAHVVGSVADGALSVTIADDGRGGADPGRGSGLRGLADRVAASDGSLDVSSAPGRGTTVRVRLPLDGGDR